MRPVARWSGASPTFLPMALASPRRRSTPCAELPHCSARSPPQHSDLLFRIVLLPPKEGEGRGGEVCRVGDDDRVIHVDGMKTRANATTLIPNVTITPDAPTAENRRAPRPPFCSGADGRPLGARSIRAPSTAIAPSVILQLDSARSRLPPARRAPGRWTRPQSPQLGLCLSGLVPPAGRRRRRQSGRKGRHSLRRSLVRPAGRPLWCGDGDRIADGEEQQRHAQRAAVPQREMVCVRVGAKSAKRRRRP